MCLSWGRGCTAGSDQQGEAACLPTSSLADSLTERLLRICARQAPEPQTNTKRLCSFGSQASTASPDPDRQRRGLTPPSASLEGARPQDPRKGSTEPGRPRGTGTARCWVRLRGPAPAPGRLPKPFQKFLSAAHPHSVRREPQKGGCVWG